MPAAPPQECPLCKSFRVVHLDTLTGLPSPDPEFAIWECSDCKIRFIHPRLVGSEANVGDVDAYVKRIRDSGVFDSSGGLNRSFFLNYYPEIYDLVERSGVSRSSQIVDIGCGAGFSTAAIHSLGYVVRGLDSSPEMIKAARTGFPDITFDIGSAQSIPTGLDLITANSVLEHVHDAVGFLHQLREKTKFLILTVPNILDAIYTESGPAFGARLNYSHVWYFEEETLGYTLRKAGFEPIIWYRSPLQFPGTLGNTMRFVKRYLRDDRNLFGGIGCLAQ